MNIQWEQSGGGSMGPNTLLKIGDKYVGHFYADASEGVDTDEVLEAIAARCNAHEVLVEALEESIRVMEALGQSVHRPTLNKARDIIALMRT